MGLSNSSASKPSIYNDLDFPVNAYQEIDGGNRRGAGEPKTKSTGKFESHVPARGDLTIHLKSRAFNKMLLIIEMDYFPRRDGIDAIKVIPGIRFGPAHHTEYLNQKDKYIIKIHYGSDTKKELDNNNKVRDKDPRIIHPEDD
ncbi:MAG: hypothetical protein GVY07_04500 [Bacteroidetes bacterium]|jgi:hypothetical protein|nr:hypothetical protein [Bacteroidota bacterium]